MQPQALASRSLAIASSVTVLSRYKLSWPCPAPQRSPTYSFSKTCSKHTRLADSGGSPAYVKQRKATRAGAAPAEVLLPSISDASDLESQQKWLAGEIQLWLDDEWTQLDIHRELGEATAQAYGKARSQGTNEIGSILLSISSDLLAFDFQETFVNAFDVANKAADMLMRETGQEVCCGG